MKKLIVLILVGILGSPVYAGVTGFTASDLLRRQSRVYDTVPFMISVWGYVTALGSIRTAFNITQNTDSTGNRNVSVYTDGTNANLCQVSDGGGGNSATTSTTITTTTWFHMTCEIVAANSRAALLNAGGKGTDTVSRTPATSGAVHVGYLSGAGTWDGSGSLAEISIWGGSMSSANMDSLAAKLYNGGAAGAGGNPININAEVGQPWSGNLKAYWPLTVHTDLTDHSGNGHTLSMVGTITTFGSHPTIEAISTRRRIAPLVLQ